MSHSIHCPLCHAVLKSPTPVPAGKKVKCPQCKQMFTTEEPQTESPPTPMPPMPAAYDSFAEDDEMAAAIAKLEADQSAGTAPPPVKPAAAPKPAEPAASDDELVEPEEEIKPIKKKPARKDAAPPRKRREEEEDEKPRSKKKRDVDEEEAEDEEPTPKKKRRDEDDGEPRSKGKKKQKGGGKVLLLTLLGVGGGLGLLLCCGGGIGGYFFFFSNPMTGKWESNIADIATMQWDFGYFGGGTVKHSFVHPLTNKKEESTAHFTYKFKSGDPATLDITVTKVEGKNANLLNGRGEKAQRFKVLFRDGDAVLTIPDLPPMFGEAGLVLRRPR